MVPKVAGPTKRARLTLSQLASYDDILTDALVDHVFYWTTIRKNRVKYNLTRGFSEEEVPDILRHDLIVNRDPQTAEQRLLKLVGFRRFLERLKTKKEQEDFKKHMRKYIGVWSNDCPFEISTTNRYTIVSHEAAVVARRVIEKGETIKYLCGNLVSMTPDEEKDLGLTRRDFSIVMSSRKKTSSLFLGPARFANHDCHANARLVTTGLDGMQVVALRQIATNEEITVTYGEDYFGVRNCECLCKTCEEYERNGWAKASTSPTTKTLELLHDDFAPYSLRHARRSSNSGVTTPKQVTTEVASDVFLKRRRSDSTSSTRKRSKLNLEVDRHSEVNHDLMLEVQGSAPPSPYPRTATTHEIMEERSDQSDPVVTPEVNRARSAPPMEHQISRCNGASALDAPLPADPDPPQLEVPTYLRASSFITSLRSLKTESAQISIEPSDTESIFDLYTVPKSPGSHIDTPPSISIASWCQQSEDALTQDEPPHFSLTHGFAEPEAPDASDDVEQVMVANSQPGENDLDAASSPHLAAEHLAEQSAPIAKEPTKINSDFGQKLTSASRGLRIGGFSLATIDAFDPRFQQRRPGDYVRTTILLTSPSSRWLDCRTCDGTWVQLEGWPTRRECPRCERHSKLYGYQWPKTEHGQLSWVAGRPDRPEKQGKRKSTRSEERVLDHRTVHRFIHARAERAEHRKGHGLEPPSVEIQQVLKAIAKECEDEIERNYEEMQAQRAPSKFSKVGRTKKGSSASRKGKVVAIIKRKPTVKSKARFGSKSRPALKKKMTKAGMSSRPKASKSGKKQKTSIFDYPSDSDDERVLGKNVRKKTKKASDKNKKTPGAKASTKTSAKASAKASAVAMKIKAKAPKTKQRPQPVKRVPNPRPGWRGWVELNDNESRPVTLEQSMEMANTTGTRRGTQLGRR